jgi:hypothetical protein
MHERISVTEAEIRVYIQLRCPSGTDRRAALVIFHPEKKLLRFEVKRRAVENRRPEASTSIVSYRCIRFEQLCLFQVGISQAFSTRFG